jgi:hypothetical protein
MSVIEPATAASTARAAKARCGGSRDQLLFTLVLYALVRSGQALAGDQAAMADTASRSNAADAREPLASAASLPASPFSLGRTDTDIKIFSATEFRPRIHAQFDPDEPASRGIGGDEPLFEGTTVWQQMADYKSQDRVRLLTLWQTRGSTLSLQTGKHGGPSLQWSSPWMMRDGASRGLLDHLFSVPFRGGANASRSSLLRLPAESPPPTKQPNLPSAGAQ